MININTKNMTTTAIGIIALSTLFFFNNYEIKPDSANLEKVAKSIQEQKIQTKTTVANELPNTKTKEKKNELKVKYHPKYKGFEIFEQSEPPKKGVRYTDNSMPFMTYFQKVKIRPDGIVPKMNEKFSLKNPGTYDAMEGYIPGEYNISFYNKSLSDIGAKNILESMSGVEVISIKKDRYGFDIVFFVQPLTQGEIYEIEQKISKNGNIQHIEKNVITLPEYDTTKNRKARDNYYSDLSAI